MHRLLERLPLPFRVLYRQFLLRVVDLEALSIHADIPRFLGQFAGGLIMFSMIKALLFLIGASNPAITPATLMTVEWGTEQNLISIMMLVAGLVAVVSWDATFPDRRDAMVLSPLPVRPRIILIAKVAASGSILGLAVLALNFATGIAVPLVMGGLPRFVPIFAAYWFTMVAAIVFLYGAVLTVQGFSALLLARRLFLRLSAVLQLAAFGLFLGVYFLQPLLPTRAAMTAAGNHWALACLPSFWFFALFNQLRGSLPSDLMWLAWRAWIGLGVVVCGAAASLLLCYLRTMKKIVEEPDLVPGARGWHWAPRFGGALNTAVVLFSIRSLVRSKHHRVVFAFYLAFVFAIAFYAAKGALLIAPPRALTADFLMYTCVMMSIVVVGLRSVFSLPISLNANWALRVTQLYPSEKYIAATRRALVLLATLPVWICAALLSLFFRPLYLSAEHLIILALVGSILTDLSLIGVSKIPFACSYLPGKSNIQYMFWGFLLLFSTIAMLFAKYEEHALRQPLQYGWTVCALGAVALGLWIFNHHQAKSAVLSFEELEPEVITKLGLMSSQPLKFEANSES